VWNLTRTNGNKNLAVNNSVTTATFHSVYQLMSSVVFRKMKETLKVMALDGVVLSATRFSPDKSNGKVVLINSATGVKQNYYHDFASFLSDAGFTVYTYDYRGIGGSRPAKLRGFKASLKDWGVFDYQAMLQDIFRSHPHSGILVAGHSVGGQIVGFSPLTSKVDALVMIGSQTPFWKNYKGFWMQVKLFIFWFVTIPFFTRIAGYFPASKLGLFEDLPKDVAKQWARWARSENYIFGEFPEMENKFSSLNRPALMISFSDDDLAPREAVIDLIQRYGKIRWDHWHFKPEDLMQNVIGHFGFFKKRMQDTLWKETLTWMNNPPSLKESKAA
jgi:predicted alpha/beta hydrolase